MRAVFDIIETSVGRRSGWNAGESNSLMVVLQSERKGCWYRVCMSVDILRSWCQRLGEYSGLVKESAGHILLDSEYMGSVDCDAGL
jgi:hypothetical protein